MGETFTKEELVNKTAVSDGNAKVLLHRWKQEGLIDIVRTSKSKTKNYKKNKMTI